jgi:cis-L-3-hydroxyproline dehydratase
MPFDQKQDHMVLGNKGKAHGLAMRTLVEYGKAFDAKRLVPIKSAHIAGTFGVMRLNSLYSILEQMLGDGLRVKVPTTVNPRPGRELSIQNRVGFLHQKNLERMLEELGVIQNYSCVCYEEKNIPSMGDIVAWSESSAVQYANSVLGARTNRNSILIDVCSAVTGYTPEFGYLLDENRRGRLLVRLKTKKMDASALGYLIGKLVVDRVPVIEHYDFSRVELKNMGGAMAASGAVALFHVEGVTPEAPDLSAVFDGKPEKEITITQDMIDGMRYKGPVDMVIFGCPQMTFDEIMNLAPRFAGRKVRKPTMFFMVPDAYKRFRETDLYEKVKEAGVRLETSCPVSALTPLQGMRKKKIMTASGKTYYYLDGSFYGTVEDCLTACGVQ